MPERGDPEESQRCRPVRVKFLLSSVYPADLHNADYKNSSKAEGMRPFPVKRELQFIN